MTWKVHGVNGPTGEIKNSYFNLVCESYTGEGKRTILTFYVDDGFFHGKVNKGIQYNSVHQSNWKYHILVDFS